MIIDIYEGTSLEETKDSELNLYNFGVIKVDH